MFNPLDILSDHRAQVHRSHEAFLEYGHQAMQAEREALMLKLKLCQAGLVSTPQSQPPAAIPNRFTPSPNPQYDLSHLQEFATGSLVKCFGDHYSIYDGRRAPRTPNGDLLLMSRIVNVNGTRGNYKEKANLVAEYDVPVNAWFFKNNAAPVMPYSIVMEIALQPCGFLATYMGCTLIYPDLELCFRNLDSDAVMLKEVDPRGKTITAKSVLTSVASSAETVIVQFDYELLLDGEPYYQGKTTFGYFTPNALANQVGLDRGEKLPPWFERAGMMRDQLKVFDLKSIEADQVFFQPATGKPQFYQPKGQLDFLDRLYLSEKGGDYGKGYLYGEKDVDPNDWFFPCHFHEDPVMPGSLGVESILQSMRMFCLHQGVGSSFKSPYFSSPATKVIWRYRGQIIKVNKLMSIEAHIKSIEESPGKIVIKADASLWKDGLRIYELTDAVISIVEGG